MELRDSLTLLFICSKIHCYLLPIFVYPITTRLDKFIHQNLETPFHLYRGNYELGTAQDRYCWQMEDEIIPVVFNFWMLPRRRGTTHVGNNSYRFAEPHRDGAYLSVGCLFPLELRLRTLVNANLDASWMFRRFVVDAYHDIERKNVYFIFISRGGS